jgi:hypothetical protein
VLTCLTEGRLTVLALPDAAIDSREARENCFSVAQLKISLSDGAFFPILFSTGR